MLLLDTIVEGIFNGVVHFVATFTAAVLAHPAVKRSVGAAIVEGMNQFIRQPNLDEHLMVMNDTLAKNQTEIARKAGGDFPRIVGNFLQGMLTGSKDEGGKSTGSASMDLVESKDEDEPLSLQERSKTPPSSPSLTQSVPDGVRKRTNASTS